jgi:predicted Rossmann-fold nucleotide-binding protein
MQAANEGAASIPGRAKSIGICIELPFEQETNSFVTQAFEHRTFFTRLHQFVLTSDAFIVAPGGIGTLLEMLMIWQLLQVHHLENNPLILVGKMWPGLIDWARSSMLTSEIPLASNDDINIPECVSTATDAVASIRRHHAEWLKRGSSHATNAAPAKRSRRRTGGN